ncbi:MAG: ATP-binding protein, partial [Pseudomonadota bacterium]
TREDVLSEIFSYPIGFWSGLVGLALTGGMLFVLRRETAPLGVLSKAADAFAEDGKARDVVEQGAREIRTLIRSFNRMQNRISGLIEGRQVMLGALGHDLRTYLTRLRLKADAAGVSSLDGDIDHLSAVLENCLALARDPSTDQTTTPIDLAKLVARCVEETVAVEVEDEPLWVQADPVSLERALRNLLENAQRYGQEPAVHAHQDGDSVVLEVADTGPGIPQDQCERLMKPFERGNAARTADGAGSGLGLSLAKLLVERDGGTLSLSQNQPQGLRVTMRFPASPEPAEGSQS